MEQHEPFRIKNYSDKEAASHCQDKLNLRKQYILHTVYRHPGISINFSIVPETGKWKR